MIPPKSTEQLLELLNSESIEDFSDLEKDAVEAFELDLDGINNQVYKFITDFNIKAGNVKLDQTKTIKLVREYTKSIHTDYSIKVALGKFIPKLRVDIESCHPTIKQLVFEHISTKTFSVNVDRFEGFIREYEIEKGNYPIPIEGLYGLFKVYSKKNRLKTLKFTVFVKAIQLYFETKLAAKHTKLWVLTSVNVKDHLTPEIVKKYIDKLNK
jgi:hypothetical protein